MYMHVVDLIYIWIEIVNIYVFLDVYIYNIHNDWVSIPINASIDAKKKIMKSLDRLGPWLTFVYRNLWKKSILSIVSLIWYKFLRLQNSKSPRVKIIIKMTHTTKPLITPICSPWKRTLIVKKKMAFIFGKSEYKEIILGPPLIIFCL